MVIFGLGKRFLTGSGATQRQLHHQNSNPDTQGSSSKSANPSFKTLSLICGRGSSKELKLQERFPDSRSLKTSSFPMLKTWGKKGGEMEGREEGKDGEREGGKNERKKR